MRYALRDPRSLLNYLAVSVIALFACVVGGPWAATAALGDSFGSGANQFEIDFVTIGDPDNAADRTGKPNPAGSVPYTYRIGKYEISEDMINKANSLGDLAINKETRGLNKPASGINWFEAARFVNWLNTSTGSTPAYKLDSGSNGGPAYIFHLWEPGDTGYDPSNLYRNSLAHYFIPSVDEWYKAAHYDPIAEVYYDYPTGSNTAPTPISGGTAAGTAVYDQIAGPADITLAGGLSPYGTMGQGGNVFEWEETDFDLVNDSTSTRAGRGVRGGYWGGAGYRLFSSTRSDTSANSDGEAIGFRVASRVPEPTTSVLWVIGALFMASSRCRGRAKDVASVSPRHPLD